MKIYLCFSSHHTGKTTTKARGKLEKGIKRRQRKGKEGEGIAGKQTISNKQKKKT